MSTYFDKSVGGQKLDVYRVLRIYGITDPAIAHAVKKLLRCGRGHKDQATDVAEAKASLTRWQEMQAEDQSNRKPLTIQRRTRPVRPLTSIHFERRGAELEDTEGHAGAYF